MGLVYATSVAADSPKLKGDYAFTGTAACLYSAPGGTPGTGGFNPNLTPVVGSRVWSQSFSAEGVRTFNGNGTGTIKGTNVTINVPPTPGFPGPFSCPGCFPPSASSSSFSASFTYTVNNDGSFTTQLSGLMTGTILTGPSAGQTFTLDLPPQVGLIAEDAKTLTIASVEPLVETLIQNGNPLPRICHRSRVLIKMDNDKGRDKD